MSLGFLLKSRQRLLLTGMVGLAWRLLGDELFNASLGSLDLSLGKISIMDVGMAILVSFFLCSCVLNCTEQNERFKGFE